MACIKTAIAASIQPNLSLWGPTGADRRPAGLARDAGQPGQSLVYGEAAAARRVIVSKPAL
jgi:hypothetical protein